MTEDSEVVKVMAKIDAVTESPSKRALRVLTVLRRSQVSTWDVLCFCGEYLGMMIPAYPWLEEDARRLTRLIYLAHYVHFGGPADEKKIAEALG